MKKKKVLLIDRKAFCNWYFDYEMTKEFFFSQGILGSLKNTGEFRVTLQELLDGVGYLPESVVANGQEPILDDSEEVMMSEYDVIKFAN